MPRRPRTDYPGAWHHVLHRGARRAPIFKSNDHCFVFLNLLESAVARNEIEIHAYSLMPNHYHLLVNSRHGNLSKAMKFINATYTQKLNLIHNWDGPIFRGRFRSQLVENEKNLPYILAYIHLNPLRANLVTRLQSECWTSHRAYIGRDPVPDWLHTDFFLALHGGSKSLHEYVLDLHRSRRSWPEQMALEAGWFKTTFEASDAKRDATTPSKFMREDEAIGRVCQITESNERDLRRKVRGPRANPARRFAVWALKYSTQLTHEMIGRRLQMSTIQVGHVLRRIPRDEEPFSSWIDLWRTD